MYHGQNYDRPMSFFERNLEQTLETDQQLTVAPYQLFNQTQTLYSNSSSPVTSYSGSSSGYSGSSSGSSQSNMHSPNELNFNSWSVMNSVLQVMEQSDDAYNVPHPDDPSDTCKSCVNTNYDTTGSHRYLQPFNFGRDEYLRNFFSKVLQSQTSRRRRVASSCDSHPDAMQLYCYTCIEPACSLCEVFSHLGHVTTTFALALTKAKVRSREILNRVKCKLDELHERLHRVQIATDVLDQKSKQANTDVIFGIRRITTLLKTRERELLTKIENMRREKLAALNTKSEKLNSGIVRLTRVCKELGDSKQSAASPLSLLISKNIGKIELRRVRQEVQLLLRQKKNCWISFKRTEETLLTALANFGRLTPRVPGAIGDRRAVRGRGNSQLFVGRPLAIPPVTVAVERTSVNSFPVIVRLNKNFNEPIRASVIIGNRGKPEENLCRPWGVATDKNGHIIVADRSNNRIQIYKHTGSFIRRFGVHGTGPGEFDRPAGVAVDSRRRIVVADKDNHRIQIFTMEGVFLLTFGEKGSRPGQFNYPWDVAVNEQCQIIVSDTRNHRVQLFSAEGLFLRKYGYEGAPNMWKHFDSPRGVAFNIDGKVVTTDFNNHKLLVIDRKFSHARVLQCECPGTTKLFLRPQGLVIDDDGNVIVADSRNHRIQIFDKNGNLRSRFGSLGKEEHEMDRPSGIALCPDGRIVVVDFGNNRVLIF